MKQARSEVKTNARAASQRADARRGQGRQAARAAGTARAFRPPPYGIEVVDEGAARIHQVAQAGLRGPSSPLPHLARIQHAFGDHDVTRVQAVMGPTAQAANAQLRSVAYASGNAVAFGRPPDLHTAAHEAAHIVQQRAGVQADLVHAGDRYERHANAVADAVVRGRSAAGLLSTMIGRDASAAPVGAPARAPHQPVQLLGELRHLPESDRADVAVTEIGEDDLLYGFAPDRERTYGRLKAHLGEREASGRQPMRLHTIDEYNVAVGNLGQMLQAWTAAVGIIQIRNGLAAVNRTVNAAATLDALTRSRQPDESLTAPIHAWTQGLEVDEPADLADKILRDWRLCAWVMMLAVHAENVGLLDFGSSAPQAGPASREEPWSAWTISERLESDRVLAKNLNAEGRESGYRHLLKGLISWWCRPDHRAREQAENESAKLAKANPRAYLDLSMWISRQVLRRTSKLGIDFVLRHLHANLYFNMFGERIQPRQSSGKSGSYLSRFFGLLFRKRDLRIGETVSVPVNDLVREMAEHRYDVPAERSPQPITVSEARYLDELLGEDPSLAGRVRIYNE